MLFSDNAIKKEKKKKSYITFLKLQFNYYILGILSKLNGLDLETKEELIIGVAVL